MKQLLIIGMAFLSLGVNAQLNGNYTIGGTTPDYNTINVAVADLSSQGVSGPVVFNIRTGVYNEQIYLPNIIGASYTNTITFQSETNNANDVTITYAGDVIVLDSTETVYIKYLTLTATSSLGSGVNILQKTDNLFFENNIVNLENGKGVNRNNTASPVIGEYCDTIAIRNNIFNSGYYGVYIDNGSSTQQHYLDISNNQILNAKVGGVVATNIGYDHDINGNLGLVDGGSLIINNMITNDTSSPSFIGLLIMYVQNKLEISKNKLEIKTTDIGPVNGFVAGLVESNNNNATTNFQNWSNNIIDIDAPFASEVIGIRIQNGMYQNIVHNSFSINGNTASSCTLVHVAAGGSNLNVVNNDFINLNTGASSYAVRTHSAIDPTSSFSMFDYNNFDHHGTNFANWLGANISSMNDYQTTSTFDANSVNIQSNFNVDANNVASLCANLSGLGTPLAYILDDYNGVARSTTAPTIGAIETVSGPTPTVVANATSTQICSGDALTLTGSGADTYTWDNGVTDNVEIYPVSTLTYTVIGTTNGCSNSAQVEVIVNPLPTILANASATTICNGDAVTLTGDGGTSYIWSNGVSDGVAFYPTATSTYIVTGTDGTCTNSAQIEVIVNDCTGFGDEVNGNDALNVYPNPSNGHFYINATSQIINSIQVFDITGARVYTSNKNLNKIDLSLQENGIYFLKILTNKQSQIIKIIKE